MFALRSLSMTQWRYGLALAAKPKFRIGADVEADPKPELVGELPKLVEAPEQVIEQPQVVVDPPAVPEKPKRRKPSPESYAHLLTVSAERGKATDKAILDVLFDWERNSKARWGAIINIQHSLALRGLNLSVDTIRDHVIDLAKAGKLCVERQILDPKHTYVSGKSNIVKYLYVYLVALNGDKGERGIVDFVIRLFCESYIERDEKGRFIGLY